MTIFSIPHTALVLAVLCFTACGGGGNSDAASKDPVTSIDVTSNDLDHGVLYLTKGTGVFVGVEGRDANGNTVDAHAVADSKWSTADGDVLRVHSLDGSAIVEGRRDWFDTVPSDAASADAGADAPYVPETTLTVKVNDLTDTVNVRVILSAAGSWLVTLDDGTSIPLDLTQKGRTVTHDGTGATGSVNDDSFSIDFAGYAFTGGFTDRTHVEGTFTDPSGSPGTWTAVRTD